MRGTGGSVIDIATLIAVSKEALAGGSKLVGLHRDKNLSNDEKELLFTATKRGEFHLLSVDQLPGYWVRVGGKDFLDEADPAFAAKYLEAFKRLCERGYIVHKSGILFVLSGSGFEKARKLESKR